MPFRCPADIYITTAAVSSDSPSRHYNVTRHPNDGSMGSTLPGIPTSQWSPNEPVFEEQDQNHFPNSLSLEGGYTYVRRPISESFSKDTNNAENYQTTNSHAISKDFASTTHPGSWTGLLSHEPHHTSRLFGHGQFLASEIDLTNMVRLIRTATVLGKPDQVIRSRRFGAIRL